MTYSILLYMHVIGATILSGTGIGIAFFMVMSNRSADARLGAHVAGIAVVADTVFTATAAVRQPLTGILLAREAGWPLLSGWVAWSLVLHLLIGTCRLSGSSCACAILPSRPAMPVRPFPWPATGGTDGGSPLGFQPSLPSRPSSGSC